MNTRKQWGLWILGGLSFLAIVISFSFWGFIYISELPQETYESIHSAEWKSLNVNRMEFREAENFRVAEVTLKAKIKENPSNPIPHFLLGTLYETTGNAEKAKSELKQTIQISTSTPWNRLLYPHFKENSHAELALIYYYNNDSEHALKELENVSASPYQMNPELLTSLQNVLKEPDRGNFHLDLGIELRKILQLKHARHELQLAQKLSVDPVLKDKAFQYLAVKLPQNEKNIAPMTRYYTLAGVLYETAYANPGMARQYYQKAIQEDPGFDWPHSQLGIVNHQEHYYEKALENAHRAIALNPRAIPSYLTLGDVAIDQGEYENAVTHYQKALSISQQFLATQDEEIIANVENQLGYAYEQLGQNSNARNHYQIAYNAAPETSTDYHYAEEALLRVQ